MHDRDKIELKMLGKKAVRCKIPVAAGTTCTGSLFCEVFTFQTCSLIMIFTCGQT